MELAKEAAALLVDGKTVGFCSRFPVEGTKPEELIPEEAAKPSMGICITTSEEDSPYERTLHLIPKVITVGIGCKKNTPAGRIEEKGSCGTCGGRDFSKKQFDRRQVLI